MKKITLLLMTMIMSLTSWADGNVPVSITNGDWSAGPVVTSKICMSFPE